MPWANTHSTDLESSSSQYWFHADHADFDFSTALTFSLWLKLESQPSSGEFDLVFKRNNAANQQSYGLIYYDTAGTKRIQIAVMAALDGSSSDGLEITQTLTTATWYNLTVTWNGATKTAKFYINGTQTGGDQVGVNVASIANGTADLAIGANRHASSSFFDGLIDDVRLWGRVLTSTEVSDLFTNPATFSNGSNLVGWWKFDNDATDSSGQSHTLTGSGSPTFTTETQWGNTQTFTEVAGTPVETVTTSPTATISVGEVMSALVETMKTGFGWNNQSKSSVSWSNQNKN